jgi:hypothetical protein
MENVCRGTVPELSCAAALTSVRKSAGAKATTFAQ